jgi:excisionase family DNA binding protein
LRAKNGSCGLSIVFGNCRTFLNESDNEPTRRDANMPEDNAPDALLTPAEVAALFRVNPKTVTRWARAGKITAIRTLGGHRRFRASEIRRCLEQMEHEGA